MKTVFLALCILLLLFSFNTKVSARSEDKQAVLVALTLNLVRFTTWPENVFNSEDSSSLIMCVIGDNVVQQSFLNIDKSEVNNKILQIRNINRSRNLNQCHLLYVSELPRNRLVQLLLEFKQQPVLTIGEQYEFLEAGGMIVLENNNGKIQLNINLPMIKKSDLLISSRILKLAKIFDLSSPSQ